MKFGTTPPTRKTITRILDKFEADGTVENVKKNGLSDEKPQQVNKCRFSNADLYTASKEISRVMFS